MTIRGQAFDALRRGLADRELADRVGFSASALSTTAVSRRIVTSKLFEPAKSWTKAWAWWHQLIEEKLLGEGSLVLICESRSVGFHVLVVPKKWLRDHRQELSWSEPQQKYNLHLSAEARNLFVDERGAGLDFSEHYMVDVS